MSDSPRTTVQTLYGEFWADGIELDLDASLSPRGTDWLFTAFAALGPRAGDLMVDVGTRDAGHTVRLVREHGLRAVAVDPVPLHVERARRTVDEAGLADRIQVAEAGIERLPVANSVADWVWCRDVLVHVDVAAGFAECARVLRPGGGMFAYVTCATDRLEPREERELFDALAIVPESTRPAALERHAAAAGLTLVSRTELGGEWRERMIEDGTYDPGADLLRVSRLGRTEADHVRQHGPARVAATRANLVWGVYQLLGKLCPTVYHWRMS